MKRIEILIHDLTDEIDDWKAEAQHWKQKYIEEMDNNTRMVNERLADSERGVANMLMFALAVTDNPDGSLNISKENRKQLSESLIIKE